jgi:hypothetical protein
METAPVLDGNAPQVAPAQAAPVAPVTAAQPMEAPAQSYSNAPSGMTFNAFVASMNFVEISFGLVGATALFYTIYYYKNKLQIDKLMTNKLQKQIDEINITLQDEINNKQTVSYDGINGSFN